MSRRHTLNQQIADCQTLVQASRLRRRQCRQLVVSQCRQPLMLLLGFAGGCLLHRLQPADLARAARWLLNTPQRQRWWYPLWLALLQRLAPVPAVDNAPAGVGHPEREPDN